MSEGTADSSRLGAKVRALRRREQLTQVQLAQRLGISASYLNLIESNRRPLPASLLIKLAQVFNADLHTFASDEDAHLISSLLEAFSDPLFEPYGLAAVEMRELVTATPSLARAVLALSELLPTRSRAFQLAHQIALLAQRGALDRVTADPVLTTDESRALGKVALANYFAGAVMLPYVPFLQAVREERYDIDVVGR